MKKLLALILALMLIAPAAMADVTFPLEETATLSIALQQTPLVNDYEDNALTKWLFERTNVQLKFVLFPSTDAATKLNLMISGGDIKAVQGTTGHASADMLVNTYAHIQQSSRVELGKKFESGFYAKPDTPSPQAVPAAGEPTISMTALLELLKDADPEMKAKLRLALLT